MFIGGKVVGILRPETALFLCRVQSGYPPIMYICVLGDFEYLQNLREALLDVGDLQTTESSMTRRFRDL